MSQLLEQYNYTLPPPVSECAKWNGKYIACNDGKYYCDPADGYKDPVTACAHPNEGPCPSGYPTELCSNVKGSYNNPSTAPSYGDGQYKSDIPEKNDMGLILGLSLGIGIPVLILIILLVVLK